MDDLGLAGCFEPRFVLPSPRDDEVRQDESRKEGRQGCCQNKSTAQHGASPHTTEAQHFGARKRMQGKYRGARQTVIQHKEQKRAGYPVEDGRAIMPPRKSMSLGNVDPRRIG